MMYYGSVLLQLPSPINRPQGNGVDKTMVWQDDSGIMRQEHCQPSGLPGPLEPEHPVVNPAHPTVAIAYVERYLQGLQEFEKRLGQAQV